MAFLSLIAAGVMVYKRQYEHAVTRIFVYLFYAALWLWPGMPIEVSRALSRYFVGLLFVCEIVSWIVILTIKSYRARRRG